MVQPVQPDAGVCEERRDGGLGAVRAAVVHHRHLPIPETLCLNAGDRLADEGGAIVAGQDHRDGWFGQSGNGHCRAGRPGGGRIGQ